MIGRPFQLPGEADDLDSDSDYEDDIVEQVVSELNQQLY